MCVNRMSFQNMANWFCAEGCLFMDTLTPPTVRICIPWPS